MTCPAQHVLLQGMQQVLLAVVPQVETGAGLHMLFQLTPRLGGRLLQWAMAHR
ncbi:hypothetical protein D3C78_1739240 [compost metagenome]